MRTLGVLGMLCCLSLANPAIAANWVRLGTSSSGSVIYIDNDSIRRDGGMVLYWVRFDASEDATVSWRESKQYYKTDCNAWTSVLLSYVEYDPQGSVVDSGTMPEYSPMKPVVPETVSEAFATYACAVQ